MHIIISREEQLDQSVKNAVKKARHGTTNDEIKEDTEETSKEEM